jgi:hypothetical protein
MSRSYITVLIAGLALLHDTVALPGPAYTSLASRDLLGLFNTSCTQIQKAVSSGTDVYYPGSLHYLADIHHWASSSSDISACSVEPGTADDVAKIVSRHSI